MKRNFPAWRALVWLLLAALGPNLNAAPAQLHRAVLVFIPAYEGSQLWDSTLGSVRDAAPRCVWGSLNVYFSSTLYFALRMPNPLTPRPLLSAGPVDVYRGFVDAMTEPHADAPRFTPYTLGADFFIFSYDWRQDIATASAPQFDRAMAGYARLHAAQTGLPLDDTHFVIVTHSMGGLVARTWLNENPAWASRIDGLYTVGAPNRGSVKAAETVVDGPQSLQSFATGFPKVLLRLIPTNVDQAVTKLTGITRPSLYELLPLDDPHWLDTNPAGEKHRIAADRLLDASTWAPYWPTAALERRLFLDDWLRQREAEGHKKIVPADWAFCQDPGLAKLKALLAQTAAWRARQGSLSHLASLLSADGQPTRLHLILGSGLLTPSGFDTWGRHDETRTAYTYAHGDDGDGTMEAPNVLDGFAMTAPNVKVLTRVTHGRLMIDPQFISYFIAELTAHDAALVGTTAHEQDQ